MAKPSVAEIDALIQQDVLPLSAIGRKTLAALKLAREAAMYREVYDKNRTMTEAETRALCAILSEDFNVYQDSDILGTNE